MSIEGKYIDEELLSYIQDNWSNTVARHTYKVHDHDNFGLIKYGDSVYIEPTYSGANIPNYVYDFVKKFCKNSGYKFNGRD